MKPARHRLSSYGVTKELVSGYSPTVYSPFESRSTKITAIISWISGMVSAKVRSKATSRTMLVWRSLSSRSNRRGEIPSKGAGFVLAPLFCVNGTLLWVAYSSWWFNLLPYSGLSYSDKMVGLFRQDGRFGPRRWLDCSEIRDNGPPATKRTGRIVDAAGEKGTFLRCCFGNIPSCLHQISLRRISIGGNMP